MDCRYPGKQKFLTRKAAKQHLRRNVRHYGDAKMAAYRCDCGFFHLGHLNEYVRAGYALDRWDRPQGPPAGLRSSR